MAIDSAIIELFKQGKEFNQILFLDNFYENVSLETESGEDLARLLTSAISDSTNTYIKRSAFKILCELTLSKKITNRFSIIGLLQDFLSRTETTLQVIALKYLPHFDEAHTNDIKEKLKELSDNSNGEVASQAYLCFGLVQLISGISKANITELIIKLGQAKPYFKAAAQATENRVDADFYLSVIDWIETVLANDSPSAEVKFNELEKKLQLRNLYDFAELGLELDMMIFQLTRKIKAGFEKASTSMKWLETRPQVQALLVISLEIQKIRGTLSTNQALLEKLFTSIFENVEAIIYGIHLTSELPRLHALRSQTQDSQLIQFIEYLLSTFPNITEAKTDNNQLLALLSEFLGSEEGLRLYQQIRNKDVTLEKAIGELLRKNKNNQLPFRTGSIHGQEVLMSLMLEIDQHLPDYPPDKREAFFNIVEEVIRFSRATLVGHEKKHFQFLFSESENGLGQRAVEQDLQNSMYTYFEHSKIADGLEHEKAKFVDAGRVDIVYKKDLITIPIELKKSLNRPDKDTLEQYYIAQAQTYTAGYDQLGIFVLLELSDKSQEPPPNFKDWFKIHHLPPSTNQQIDYPDYVISVIIPGNKTTPSAKSTYK